MRRLLVTGAAGSGTSTLGSVLAVLLGCPLFDTDDFVWVPTDPPYQAVRPPAQRLTRLRTALDTLDHWVLAGSIAAWGDAVIGDLDMVIFLSVPTELRLERLKRREAARHGARIAPGGDLAEIHAGFLAWAAEYETVGLGQRSRIMHESWLADLPCPVLRLDGSKPVPSLAATVLERLPYSGSIAALSGRMAPSQSA
jgi:adenylate kinase family enzyme